MEFYLAPMNCPLMALEAPPRPHPGTQPPGSLDLMHSLHTSHANAITNLVHIPKPFYLHPEAKDASCKRCHGRLKRRHCGRLRR